MLDTDERYTVRRSELAIKFLKNRDMHKIKPRVKKLLVDALRSGQYARTKNFLCLEKRHGKSCKFCVLGVLCQLYVESHSRSGWVQGDRLMGPDDSLSIMGDDVNLPATVEHWAGMRHNHARLMMRMNDSLNLEFSAIADAIEQCW